MKDKDIRDLSIHLAEMLASEHRYVKEKHIDGSLPLYQDIEKHIKFWFNDISQDSNPHECPNCNWQCTCGNNPCTCCSVEVCKCTCKNALQFSNCDKNCDGSFL